MGAGAAAIVVLLVAAVVVVPLLVRRQASAAKEEHVSRVVAQLMMPTPQRDPAEKECRESFGSNEVQILIKLLQTSDSNTKSRFLGFLRTMPRMVRRAVTPRPYPMSSSEIRTAAARALKLMGTNAVESASALVATLNDSHLEVSLEAADALGRMGPGAVPALLPCLESQVARVRHGAAYALGEIGPEAKAALPLLKPLLNDTNTMIAASAAYSIQRIGGRQMMTNFTTETQRDRDEKNHSREAEEQRSQTK